MSFTFADLFCGAGGSISGLVESGAELVLGANHSERAIETVSSNYRDADFLCTDINHYDMRRLPHTDVLWASVICTEMSPAGGNKKHRGQGSLDLEEYGHVPSEAYERTRACALDVIRATEVHRYKAVIVENVVEFATTWELYDWWVEGMTKIRPGYNVQVVNVSAAHVYSDTIDPAPQWRDRIYIVFTRKGIPLPDLDPRPPSWCPTCEGLVDGRQSWKKVAGRKIGKYGQQYVYRCPIDGDLVEPLVLPAISALDMDDVGQRIGDRKRPLAANTMARIEWGIRTFWSPTVVAAAGNTYERPGSGYYDWWVEGMTKIRPGYNVQVVNRKHGEAVPAGAAPVPTVTGQGRHHEAVWPPLAVQNYGGWAKPSDLVRPADSNPLGTITTRDSHALVIPYRRGRAKTTAEPLHTVATRDSAALVQPDDLPVDVMDCYYRMLHPREHLRAQRFRDAYVVTGNRGEQTLQAGNAVPCNVAEWIGQRLAAVLA